MRHRCLASFIVFILFFSVLGFISFFQMKLILNAKFTSNFLDKTNIYNNLSKIGGELAKSAEDTESKQAILTVTQSIDPVWLKKQVNTNLPPLFEYLWGKTARLNLIVDTTIVKSKLPPDFQKDVTEMLKTIPECKPGQTPTQTPDANNPPCIDSATYKNFQTLSQMPDTVNVGDFIKEPDKTFGKTKLVFTIIKIGFWFDLILSLLLIGCLILLGRTWWPSIPRWIGLSLVLPSGLALFIDVAARLIIPIIQDIISQGLKPETSPIFKPIIYAIDSQTFIVGIILSGSIFLIGWILIILSYILPHPEEPKTITKNAAAIPSAGGLTEAK